MTTVSPDLPLPPRQAALAFEAPVLQGLSPSERLMVTERLASLLIQAAEPAKREDTNEER